MVKVYECAAVMAGCRFVIHAEDSDEVLIKAVEHLHSFHDIEHLSDHMKARLHAIIRDESERPLGWQN